MAQKNRKDTTRKKNNIITINPLKINEFSATTRRVNKVDKSKQAKELSASYRAGKSKQLIEEIKESTSVSKETVNYINEEAKDPKQTDVCCSSSSRRESVPRNLPTVKRYDIKPIIPAQKKELIHVAKAMHRNEFGSRLQTLFQPEKEAALDAIECGVYIGWRCEEYTWDCIRLGKHSRCFCDHNLDEHEAYNGKSIKVKCRALNCPCKSFAFIPERPQDIGEWWLQKRPGFDVVSWRAKCRCKHTHVTHDAETKICSVRGCNCFSFKSDFLCAACDRHWEDHWTFFDTTNSRKEKGLPVGEECLPFHEMTELRDIILHGEKESVSIHRGRIQNAISGSKSQMNNSLIKSRQGVPQR